MIANNQMPQVFRDVIDKQWQEYQYGVSTANSDSIPDTNQIPKDQPHWLKIPDIVCVFVDMKNSTQLSATAHDKSTASAYQLFTGTAIRLFDAFDAPYIDVRGDGVFALFNQNQAYRAFAAAVTFKTFAHRIFAEEFRRLTNGRVEVSSHIGIDQKTVLVRRLGMRVTSNRTDRQNEVWAGKPVNMASKLSSIGEAGELIVSDRYFNKITDEHARWSCGCAADGSTVGGTKTELWRERALPEGKNFDFTSAYRLVSPGWCVNHGSEFCSAILELDGV